MNHSVTSKEAILRNCRQLVSEQGLSSLNMRLVAKSCKVALGSLYYYFPSKNDLLIATIESVWEDIFYLKDTSVSHSCFTEYIDQIFNNIQSGIQKYPNFFTIYSMSISSKAQTKAQNSMEHYLTQIKQSMSASLHADEQIKATAFSNKFTKDDFIDFVLSNIIDLLIRKKDSCNVLLEVIRRTIY